MKLIDVALPCESRTTEWSLYALGDLHVGALNCAEDKIKALVKRIAANPYARWLGGGDLCDNVILTDVKRFDPTILPDWMLKDKDPEKVRAALQDIVGAQKKRLFELLKPIRHQCLGLIEGNHEYSIMKYHNRDLMKDMCEHFGVENLTDCAFVRFKFTRKVYGTTSDPVSTVRAFITHGHGGGRTSGAEPMCLYRLAADKECEIVMKGHSHTYCIHHPIPMLSMPSRGELPKDPIVYDKFAGNWGAFVYTYKTGPSTYASRENYPVRPMYTFEVKIRPFCQHNGGEQAHIEMLPVKL